MTKTTTIFSLLLCGILFVACKKDYTCKCTASITVPGYGTFSADSSYIINKTTKKKAKSNCDETSKQLNADIQSQGGGTVSCSVL